MKLSIQKLGIVLMCCSLLVLSGCKKSSSSSYSVSVNVSGLIGSGMVLQMNSAYNLAIVGNGVSTFSYQLNNTDAYFITILNPPGGPNQTCTIANANGVVASANVTNINVVCAPVEFAYLTNKGSNTVAPYVLDLSSGALSIATSPTPTGATPVAFAVSASGRYAFALNQSDMTVSSYLANSSTGLLLNSGSAVGTGTSTVPAGMPVALAVDPGNAFVYVADNTANSITGFVINSSSAALTCIGNNAGVCPAAPLVSNLPAPLALTITKSSAGEFLFATSASGNVYSYAINGSGQLTAGIAQPTGVNPVAIAATGTYVYVVNQTDGTVSGYTNTSGVLSTTGTAVSTGGASPVAIAINPAGTVAYVANSGSNLLSVLSISANGALTLIGTSPTGSTPVSVSVDPKGKYVYVADQADGSVFRYTIAADGTTGTGVAQSLGNSPVSIVTVAAD